MSRRSKTLKRGKRHVPRENPDTGCCAECGRPMSVRNDMHIDEYPPTDPAAAAVEDRRYGD